MSSVVAADQVLPAGPELWGYPVADDQVFVAREFPVSVFAAQVVGAARLGAVRVEAGFRSERFLEAV